MKKSILSQLGVIKPTGEYNGGVLAGFGFGMFVMAVILLPAHRVSVPWIWFSSGACIAIGSLLARVSQRKRFQKDEHEKKDDVA